MDACTAGDATPKTNGRTPKASGSEARRRRIVDRGSDRLALITGRIKNLPTESESESGSNQLRGHSYTASCPPSISQIHLSNQSSEPLDNADSSKNENKVLDTLPTKDVSVLEGSAGPYMRKCESSMETSRVPSFDVDMRRESSQLTSIAENPQLSTSNTEQRLAPRSHVNKFITLQDVSSSIAVTKNHRALCSLAMAIFVVLSYLEFPILGSLKRVISFRPLYLLVLANITMVIAQLLEKYRGLQRPEQEGSRSPVVENSMFSQLGNALENSMFNQLGNALEIALMLQNVMGALFLDCSIYSITVICGISLAQSLS